MGYKLFLDDIRIPVHCVTYMQSRIGRLSPIYLERDWVICRNYGCFVATILDLGLPSFISFDHDLADEHYTPESYWDNFEESKKYQEEVSKGYKEKTGYECAEWLVKYCETTEHPLPDFVVHSMNPVGAERIMFLLNKFKQEYNDRERI